MEREEPLEERVKGFWDARIAGEDVTAYNYETHAKDGTLTATQYVRARSPVLRYKSYEVKGIEKNGDEAVVTIDLRYRVAVPGMRDFPFGITRKDRWVRLDGQWYRHSRRQDEKQTG